MRNWTRQERQRQRELIIRHQPWTRSTGPKTVEGKLVCSQNALKHGQRSARHLESQKKLRQSFRTLRSQIVNSNDCPDAVVHELVELYYKSRDFGDLATALRVLDLLQRFMLCPHSFGVIS